MSAVEIEIPRRPDGTPKAFWYSRETEHVMHRNPDGTIEMICYGNHHG